MKKVLILFILLLAGLTVNAQDNRVNILQDLEKGQPAVKDVSATATLKSSSRLFGAKDDLTSVILIIPSGSEVAVIDSDSTYLHVTFEENEGYILKRHAIFNKSLAAPTPAVPQQQVSQEEQPVQEQQMSRFSYLENKYGSDIAARLSAGKIWKGMNTEMVRDSWGKATKINRVISGNTVKEEWIFKNTWLYFEDNSLVEWGPIR
jgi:hypothetical protein